MFNHGNMDEYVDIIVHRKLMNDGWLMILEDDTSQYIGDYNKQNRGFLINQPNIME